MSWFFALYLSLTASILQPAAPPASGTVTQAPAPPPPPSPAWVAITPGISNGI